MGENIRLVTGILGNAASLFLYAAPILTFRRVIIKRSTEKFSCVPYIISLLNCLLYTWYGLPLVSKGWENLTIVTINGIGIVLEASFIITYIWFSVTEQKKFVCFLLVPVMVLFSISAFVSSSAFHDHHQRKVFIGSIGLVASISMYTSPLVAMKRVVATKSVEFMPFNLSLFSFLASSFWMIYGLLGHDFFIAAPNFLGTPMAALQLVLYFIYMKNNEDKEEKYATSFILPLGANGNDRI